MKAPPKPDPIHQAEKINGAVLLDEMKPDEPEWRTGGVIDMFNGVYREMARPTKARMGFAPAEVDAMEVSTVGVLIGAGIDLDAKMRNEVAELAARRRAGTLPERWWEEDMDDQ